ncbi:MAG: ATP synthase subunit I [Thermoanaerobaculia bacterium]|jgi:hypothetical protein
MAAAEAPGGAESPVRPFLRTAVALAVLAATSLAALGRFRAALALTLGAAVAIVSALWLSGFFGRFAAPERSTPARIDWKLGLKAVLRYALVGLALWASVQAFPADVPWLVVGLSTVVAAAVIGEILAHLRGRRGGTDSAR